MPLFRISLRRGRTPQQLTQIADTIHQVAVRSFNVPADDRFQVIRQHEPHEFFYDPHYMDVARSEDMIFIQVFAGKVRTREMKRAFYRDLAETLSRVCQVAPDDVFVVVTTSYAEDWSFGQGLAQMLGERAENRTDKTN